jgi:hypothetical protein
LRAGQNDSVISRRYPSFRFGRLLLNSLMGGKLAIKDDRIFNAFMASIPNWWPSQSDLCHAQMMLIHPRNPTAGPALAYIRNLPSGWSPHRGLIQLHLDTARFLLSKDNVNEASWVLRLAGERFPEGLGLSKQGNSTDAPRKSSTEEAANLHLLDGLSVG